MAKNEFESKFGEKFIHWLRSILENKIEGISEYELIQSLSQSSFANGLDINMADNFSLFQTHFILFHGLYLLRESLHAEQKAILQINSSCIVLKPYLLGESNEVAEHDELGRYYLDWQNFQQASVESVGQMLDDFWMKFSAAEQRIEALAILGLEDGVQYPAIRLRYRELAMQHHPDRGGDDDELRRINQAMQILKNYYN